jgi:hypothetical protein
MRPFLFAAICLMSTVSVMPAVALDRSYPLFGWGIVQAVGSEDKNLLLQTRDRFALVILNADATIRDARGARMALRDVSRGCDVEYVGEIWNGMTFTSSLRVSCNPSLSERQPSVVQARRGL